MKQKKWIQLGLGVLSLAFLVTNTFAADIVLRIGDVMPPASFHARGIDKFAEEINGAKVGIEVKTFHASQLGPMQAQVQNVKLGVQDGVGESFSWYDIFSKDLRAAEAPFIFSNREHFERWVRSDSFKKIEQDVAKNGNLRMLMGEVIWRRGPYRVMMGKRPVLTLEELSKIKLRLHENETVTRLWGKNGLGANTVNIPWGDVYLALRQGVCDAVNLPIDLAVPMKFSEVALHLMNIEEFWQIIAIGISEKKWQSFNDNQRKVVLRAHDEAAKWYNQKIAESMDGWLKELKEKGVQFHEINRTPFIERIREVNKKLTAEGYWRPGLMDEIDKLR